MEAISVPYDFIYTKKIFDDSKQSYIAKERRALYVFYDIFYVSRMPFIH
jgi:hypothetical protein